MGMRRAPFLFYSSQKLDEGGNTELMYESLWPYVFHSGSAQIQGLNAILQQFFPWICSIMIHGMKMHYENF